MAVFIRAKHVTDPLDARVRARLRGEMTGYSINGSDHDPSNAGDNHSCFSGLLHAFLDTATDEPNPNLNLNPNEDSDSVLDSAIPIQICTLSVAGKLRNLLTPPPSYDPLRSRLVSEVDAAATALRLNGSAFRRAVMLRLRERGFNAGICKARWESGGGLTAGSYEYIDVVYDRAGEEDKRYIVDLGFAAEFEVARATEEYVNVAEALPTVMVAQREEVRAAVKIMAEAARKSLKSRGMSMPPWRKNRYMMAKWLGTYRRTVSSLGVVLKGAGESEVRCRAVGFRTGGK